MGTTLVHRSVLSIPGPQLVVNRNTPALGKFAIWKRRRNLVAHTFGEVGPGQEFKRTACLTVRLTFGFAP